MVDKRQRAKGRKTEHTFAGKPHHIFRPNFRTKTPSPASALSHMAAHLLDNLISQFDGKNNGDFSAAMGTMKLYGWSSQGSIHKAITELLALGFIEQTRQGGRNQCSLYAVTWLAIDECNGKLDVNPTNVASNLWKPENKEKIDWRYIQAWEERKTKPQKLNNVVTMRTTEVTKRTSH